MGSTDSPTQTDTQAWDERDQVYEVSAASEICDCQPWGPAFNSWLGRELNFWRPSFPTRSVGVKAVGLVSWNYIQGNKRTQTFLEKSRVVVQCLELWSLVMYRATILRHQMHSVRSRDLRCFCALKRRLARQLHFTVLLYFTYFSSFMLLTISSFMFTNTVWSSCSFIIPDSAMGL